MTNWKDRIMAQPDFTTMSEEDLRSWFRSWIPAGSGPISASSIICKTILDICELRGIDTTDWMK